MKSVRLELALAWVEVNIPVNLPPLEEGQEEIYRRELIRNMTELRLDGHWDRRALETYMNEIKKSVMSDPREWSRVVKEAHKKSFDVGSELYVAMYEASAYGAEEKAQLVIRQMGGFVDAFGFLQLEPNARFQFDPDMPPHGDFLSAYAQTVQTAYGKSGLVGAEGGEKVHKFRVHIDRHNIDFIRGKYGEGGVKTDEDDLRKEVLKSWKEPESYKWHNVKGTPAEEDNFSKEKEDTQ